jgi:hypothetical protein
MINLGAVLAAVGATLFVSMGLVGLIGATIRALEFYSFQGRWTDFVMVLALVGGFALCAIGLICAGIGLALKEDAD